MQRPEAGKLVPIRNYYVAMTLTYKGKNIEVEATPDEIKTMMMRRSRNTPDWTSVEPDTEGFAHDFLEAYL